MALLHTTCGGIALRCARTRGDVSPLCARSRGEPSSARCEQRLSERLTPRPCEPVCACTGIRGHAEKERSWQTRRQNNSGKERAATRISARAPTRSAASRAVMAGWAGEGGGRFGERREYEAPTLPSTPRQHGAARHHTRQPRSTHPKTRPRLPIKNKSKKSELLAQFPFESKPIFTTENSRKSLKFSAKMPQPLLNGCKKCHFSKIPAILKQ